jgi:fimbrial chaperone protein
MEMNVKTAVLIFLTLLPAAITLPANAASLGIWPINPRIDVNESATAIWIKNNERRPVTLQIRVMDWHQNNGEDEMQEQQTVIASPPMVKVNPGDQQMVRIVNRHGNVSENITEHSHRIFVDEIPDTRQDKNEDAHLRLQMRYSLPLFSGVRDKGKNIPNLLKNNTSQLLYRITGTGEKFLEIENKTNFHARLSQVKAIQSSGSAIALSDGLLGYVLPGQTMRWPLSNQQAAFIDNPNVRIQFTQELTEISIVPAAI